MKILLINTAFLGDVIFSAPLIDALIAAGHAVTLVARPRYGALLARPCLTVVEYAKRGRDRGPRALWRLGGRLRRAGFDVVLGAHPSVRSGLLARRVGAPVRLGWGPIGYTTRVRRGPRFIEDQLAFAEALGVPVAARLPQIEPDAAVRRVADRVALLPGSRWATKQWPRARWGRLAEGLIAQGLTPIWVGAPDEVGCVTGPGIRCFPRGLTPVRDALARAAVAVGGDSGLAHLARAVGTPTVMLFGPTAAERHPPDPGRRVLSHPDLACRPCSPHGPAHCPLGHHRCMEDLTLGAVERAIYASLGP